MHPSLSSIPLSIDTHIQTNKIRILLLSANPLDSVRLNIEEELRSIDRALHNSEYRHYFDVKTQVAVRFYDLPDLLMRYRPHIVHFSGHGSEMGGIVVLDDKGESRLVSTHALSKLFVNLKDDIRCVILNACFSAKQAKAIAKHIDVVIGVPSLIADETSIEFSKVFYLALGYGRDLKTAFELGCLQTIQENAGKQQRPQLFARTNSTARQFVIVTSEPSSERLIDNDWRVPIDATLYTKPNILAAPQKLWGQQEPIRKALDLLEKGDRVQLVGFMGVGKTALAATIANQYLQKSKGPIAWLRCGKEQGEVLLEVLASLASQSGVLINRAKIAGQIGDAKINAVRDVLEESPIALVVLDDIRNDASLEMLQKVIPTNVRVLVTSQRRYSGLRKLEIESLEPDAALELLSYFSGSRADKNDPKAALLCQICGYHPYALQIAGKILDVDEKTPEQLLQQIYKSPHTISPPDVDGGFDQTSSIKATLESSFEQLDVNTKIVFCALGAFGVSGVTIELLALYLSQPAEVVRQAMENLGRRSLAHARADTDYFSLHDLTFSFMREKLRESAEDYQSRVTTVIEEYVTKHAHDFDRLELELPNILSAVEKADESSLLRIICLLTIGGYPEANLPSYFDTKGHTLELLQNLDRAIELTKSKKVLSQATLHYLFGKQGNAYLDRGMLEKALEAYQHALKLAPTKQREAMAYSVCGKVLAMLGKFTEADAQLKKARSIANKEKDDSALVYILQQMCFIAGELKNDYEEAKKYAAEAVKLSERIGDPSAIGFALLNLGSAEFESAIAKGLRYHQEAINYARKSDDDELLALGFEALGRDYHARLEMGQTKEYFDQAISLYRRLGKDDLEKQLRSIMIRFGYLEGEITPL